MAIGFLIFGILTAIGVLHIIADLYCKPRLRIAVCLNLRLDRSPSMANPGDKFNAVIAPTAADGGAAPVTAVIFGVNSPSYDVSAIGDAAVLTATSTPGTGIVLTVTATSAAGVTLTATAALADVVAPAVPEAVALNLTVTPA